MADGTRKIATMQNAGRGKNRVMKGSYEPGSAGGQYRPFLIRFSPRRGAARNVRSVREILDGAQLFVIFAVCCQCRAARKAVMIVATLLSRRLLFWVVVLAAQMTVRQRIAPEFLSSMM